MSRSTQYIGLNRFADELVQNATNVEDYVMTRGMFDENIRGAIYHMKPPEGPNVALKYIEEVQAVPWSSGPMIFTHLRRILTKECGQVLDMGLVCSWMVDPSLMTEYDYETGRYYV